MSQSHGSSHGDGQGRDSRDEWAGEPARIEGYDPSEFYVTSSDKRGHQSSIKVNVPAGMPGEIAAIVQRFPSYRTPHDFHRDALVHRIMQLRDADPELAATDWGLQFVREAILESRQEQIRVEKDLLAKFKKALDDFRDAPMLRMATLLDMRDIAPTCKDELVKADYDTILKRESASMTIA